MFRFVAPLVGVVMLLCAGRVLSQPPIEPKDGKITVKLTLHPTAVQRPLSRNYLLPEYKDSIPGNRVQMFLRLFMEQDNFFGREESAKREAWEQMPLANLPTNDELKDYGGKLLGRDAVDAARMLNADWQLWPFLRRDGFGTLLPDIQKFRQLASTLQTRARGQIRNGDHAGAIVTLRTLFALARTCEANPTLIGQLVGFAIANVGCDAAEELLQLPGCPNLFWSFTDLPSPFLDTATGAQGERLTFESQFASVLQGPVTEAELARTIKTINDVIGWRTADPMKNEPPSPSAKDRYSAWSKDPKRVEASRARLVESGVKPEAVKGMSALQVVVADDLQQSMVEQDEQLKWLRVPFWMRPQKEADDARLKDKTNHVLVFMNSPFILKVKQAQGRVDQRLAALRLIEAVRLHAHENGGKVPVSLDEIKLPLPLDPVTGKPFSYAVKDGIATISGGNASPDNEQTNRVYEVRIEK